MGNSASFPIVSLPDDRIVMVTGANCGIGYEIAKWSAMMGATVILACRSEDRARKAMEKMQEEFENEIAKGTAGLTDKPHLALEFMKVDLASFKSVDTFCKQFNKSGRALHVLVCNAGVTSIPYTETEDRLEHILQVNYLSHFIVTAKLLPTMKRSGLDCRILFVSSVSERFATFSTEVFNKAGSQQNYSCNVCYFRSKLYQIMQMFAMSRRLTGTNITVNSLHPGIVETEIWRNSYSWISEGAHLFSRFLYLIRTPIQGATCAIDLVVNPKYAGVSGYHWKDCKKIQPSRVAMDTEKQEALWKATLSIIKRYLTQEEILIMEGELKNNIVNI